MDFYTSLDPVDEVYALLGLTEANGGHDLVPVEDVERALILYPQNTKYAAANIARQLASQAAIANDPQQFSLQGVMSIAMRDPAVYWDKVYRHLLAEADQDYNRDRLPSNVTMSEIKARDQMEEGPEYSDRRAKYLKR